MTHAFTTIMAVLVRPPSSPCSTADRDQIRFIDLCTLSGQNSPPLHLCRRLTRQCDGITGACAAGLLQERASHPRGCGEFAVLTSIFLLLISSDQKDGKVTEMTQTTPCNAVAFERLGGSGSGPRDSIQSSSVYVHSSSKQASKPRSQQGPTRVDFNVVNQ